MFFLPSDVARLVLGYLKENKLTKTYSCLLSECELLQEYYQLLKSGAELEISPSPLGVSLITILEEWGRLRQKDNILSTSSHNATEAGKQREDRMSPHSSTCNTQGKKSNIHRRRSSYSPRALRVKVIDSFDDTAESEVDSEDGENYRPANSRPCMHGDAISTEEESDCQRQHLRRSRLHKSRSPWEYHGTTKVSNLRKRRTSPRHRTDPQDFHRRSRHEQFHKCACHMTLLQSNNPGKSGDKYPNLMNLLQVSSMCKDNVQTERSPGKNAESSAMVQHEKSLAVSEPDPSISGDGPVNCNETQTIPTSNKNTSGTVSATSSISSIVIATGSNTGSKSGKSPSKRSQNLVPKTPSKASPIEDLSSSTKSPRRKKPKTPRKRNSVSPTNSVKELSGSEDKLPLFKQVLSDRRLHEKLAETCNIVTGQLKLSVSGGSTSGDKPKVISPPQRKAKDESQAVTASKSLEEILDLDTNYASEFLSENIDMSDPAFDCLFKLFGTDKESFSENIRKENQKAVTETEKLQRDLEELERSMNEEFGPRSNKTSVSDKQGDGTHLVLPESTSAQADPVYSMHLGENRVPAFSSTSSQDQITVHPSNEPASPYISQSVCQSPFLAGDGVRHCIAGDGVGQFTALLRGHELGSSPAHSTPSRKSTYSTGNCQYIASPASVTTQPFSPYPCSSPAGYLSPRSNVATDIPGTPVTMETQVSYQEYPSQRCDARGVTNERNHVQSSQPVSNNFSPPATTDLLSGSPSLQNNGPYTPPATTQVYKSNWLPPVKTNNSGNALLTVSDKPFQDEGTERNSVSMPNKDFCRNDKTLSDTNFDTANGEKGTNDSNSVVLENGVTTILNFNSHQYQENPGLTNIIYSENGSSNLEPSTIVNTIGCISLPNPDTCEENAISDEAQPKKKRATRSDKGKSRKKTSDKDTDKLQVLKSLLSQKNTGKPATEEGLIESDKLTEQDFENQQLVLLSPGGSSTLKIPVLDCIDEISSPGRALDRKSGSASDSESEESNCISITRESQVTAALVDSIKSGNTNDIIKNAKDMADDNKDEKKKGCIKKLKRVGDSKVDKSKDQRINQTSPSKPNVESEQIFTATPLHYKYRNFHVRILDFGMQYKPILPKLRPSKAGVNAVISDENVVCKSNFIPPPLTGSTIKECVDIATSSFNNNEKRNLSVSANDSSSPLKLESVTSGNITILTKTASPPSKVSTSTINSIKAKTPNRTTSGSDPVRSLTNCDSSCSDNKENKSKLASLTNHGTSDLVAKDSDSVPVKRLTRSSKPATLERLNDKGIAEKVDNSDENSMNGESLTSERIIYRRPKGGKDMRVIIKHSKAWEEKDDTFADFSENASPQSKVSDTENMLDFQVDKECSIETQKRSMVEVNEIKGKDTELQLKKGDSNEIPCDKDKNKEKFSLKENGTKVSTMKGSSDKGKSPPKKKVAHKSKSRKSLGEKIAQSGSSSEDLPLSTVKNRLVECVQDAKGSGNKSKCTSSHSRNKKDRSINEKDNLKKIKLKDKHTRAKENEEKFKSEETSEKTPMKCPRNLQLDEITPSKESWMEHVGLTPTKDLMTAHSYISPGRPNPLDIIAACQNATPSERMRLRNNSPYKTPSKVRHKTPAKRLFDSVSEQNPLTQTDKDSKQHEVERIVQILQDNNPGNNLMTKVTSSSTCTNKALQDGKSNKEAAGSSKSRKEKDKGKNSKSKDICERKKSSEKKEQPKATKEKLRDKSSKKRDTKKQDTILSSTERRTVIEKDRDIFVDKNDSEDQICQEKSAERSNSLQVLDTEVCIETGETVNDDPKELENDLKELNSATDFLVKEMKGVKDTLENTEIQVNVSESKANEHVSGTVFESKTKLDEEKEINTNDSSQCDSENRTTGNDENVEHINNTKDRDSSKNFSPDNKDDSESEAEKSKKSQNSGNVNDRTRVNDGPNAHDRNSVNDINDHINDNCSVNEKGASDMIQRNTGNTEDSNETITEVIYEQEKAHADIRIAERDSAQYEDRFSGLRLQNDNINILINDVAGEKLQDSVRNNTESTEKIYNSLTMEEMGVVRVREDNLVESEQSEVLASTNDEGVVRHHNKHNKKKKSKKRKREESVEADSEERHKKKRKKHSKHKEKRHKKHRKSAELSNLNIDAALSQLYTQGGTTADNPYRTPQTTGRLSSPVGQIVTEEGEPTWQTAPRINSEILRVSEHEQPLKHSTPILNNNFNKDGAFGTLFSPVTDNS